MPEWACRLRGVDPVLSGPRTLMPRTTLRGSPACTLSFEFS
jgi:hypothetical protein